MHYIIHALLCLPTFSQLSVCESHSCYLVATCLFSLLYSIPCDYCLVFVAFVLGKYLKYIRTIHCVDTNSWKKPLKAPNVSNSNSVHTMMQTSNL